MARVHYEGSFDVNKPRDFVYNFLVEPRNVASLIPGVESVEVLDPDNFRVRASLGVGAIKGYCKHHGEVRREKASREC
jgi:Uncharacterized conserved protein